jgi:hypothetical protein
MSAVLLGGAIEPTAEAVPGAADIEAAAAADALAEAAAALADAAAAAFFDAAPPFVPWARTGPTAKRATSTAETSGLRGFI